MALKRDTPPGTKVRCVNESGWDCHDSHVDRMNSWPRKGRTYTVRDIVPTETEHGVRLLEVQNPVLHFSIGGDHEPCFGLHRFEVVQ